MAFKTLLTVATDGGVAGRVTEEAAALASAWDAHLDVMCLGVDRTQTGYYYAGANAMVLQETLNRAQSDAGELAGDLRKALERTDARWSLEEGVAQLADIGRHVASRARFCDLAVLAQPYVEGAGVECEPVLEGALFDGHAPVLVLPESGSAPAAPRRILLGWNESAEALAAARAAMPLLRGADAVHVVVIDPPSHGPDRSDPGGHLAQWLARHGVKAEVDVLTKTLPRVSEVLARHATDTEADLLVMGAYGHSRFREAILGGATRDMLERAKLPVFMAH